MSGPKHKAQTSAGTRSLVILQKRPTLSKIFPHLSPALGRRPNLAQWELLSRTSIHMVPGPASTWSGVPSPHLLTKSRDCA